MPSTPQPAYFNASAEYGSYLRARSLLAAVDKTCGRLDDPNDREALHDFRVALRRLRTFLRAHKTYLPLKRKYRRKLRDLARNTGAARDLEVQVELLRAEQSVPALQTNLGVELVTDRLSKALEQQYPPLRRTEARIWHRMREPLQKQFEQHLQKPDSGYSFLEATRQLASANCDVLDKKLTTLSEISDDLLVHRTRITGKRLRYLLEPVSRYFKGGRAVIQELEVFQDALGDYHDAHALLQSLGREAETVCGSYARDVLESVADDELEPGSVWDQREPLSGLVKLAETVKSQRVRLWSRFRTRFINGRPEFISGMRAFIAQLVHEQPREEERHDATAPVVAIGQYRQEKKGPATSQSPSRLLKD